MLPKPVSELIIPIPLRERIVFIFALSGYNTINNRNGSSRK